MRLDQALVLNGSFESRHQAQIEIKAGRVLVNNTVILKPSFQVESSDIITCLDPFNPYVSKGGLKLKKALDTFKIDFKNATIMDIGASTGGFTEVAIREGASHVYAIEKGHAQFHHSLINHGKITLLESTDFLLMNDFTPFKPIDYYVIDVSFISSLLIIEHIMRHQYAPMIVLIKPQFEHVSKKGLITHAKDHQKILKHYQMVLNDQALYMKDLTVSPIKGGKGNIEFLAYITKEKSTIDVNNKVNEAHIHFKEA